MSDLPHGDPMHAGHGCKECEQSWKEWQPFIDPKDAPKGYKASRFRKGSKWDAIKATPPQDKRKV